MILDRYHQALQQIPQRRWSGRISKAVAGLIESVGPHCALGDCCIIRDHAGNEVEGQVVGFHGSTVLSMPLYPASGVRFGDTISTWNARPSISVTDSMIGRVVNAQGHAIDGGAPLTGGDLMPVVRAAPNPFEREPIQRSHRHRRSRHRCFSHLRTRPARRYLRRQRRWQEHPDGHDGARHLRRPHRGRRWSASAAARCASSSKTHSAKPDAPLHRGRLHLRPVAAAASARRAIGATRLPSFSPRVASTFCWCLDSITRFAMAQREIGLAAGEPPTAKGYTPSVFTLLSQLVERAGNFRTGSITAFYTVLMEGDDQMDPIVDAVRSLLDGHILLDRRLTSEGHFPPIQLLESLSRLMPAVCSPSTWPRRSASAACSPTTPARRTSFASAPTRRARTPISTAPCR